MFNQQQAESQAKEIKNKLDLATQQSELEDGLSLLQTKWQRNRDQAGQAKVKAESASGQAGDAGKVIIPPTANGSIQYFCDPWAPGCCAFSQHFL